jgi:hypothetical protein
MQLDRKMALIDASLKRRRVPHFRKYLSTKTEKPLGVVLIINRMDFSKASPRHLREFSKSHGRLDDKRVNYMPSSDTQHTSWREVSEELNRLHCLMPKYQGQFRSAGRGDIVEDLEWCRYLLMNAETAAINFVKKASS